MQDRPAQSSGAQGFSGDWRGRGPGLSAWFDAPSLVAGSELVRLIAARCERDGRPLPDVDLRPTGVRVQLGDRSRGLAGDISAAARSAGLDADPGRLWGLSIAVAARDARDAGDGDLVGFWRAVLGYRAAGAVLSDPWRRTPAVEVRSADPGGPGGALRNRLHVDVGRPADAVPGVRAEVGEPYGAYGLTLADADGNEVDLVPGAELAASAADWQTLFGAIVHYPTSSSGTAAELAVRAAALAEAAGRPLLIDLRDTGVALDSGKDRWESEDGADPVFVQLATSIQAAARDLGLVPDSAAPRFVQLAFDAVDVVAVRRFWMSLLGYVADPRPHLDDVSDPDGSGPVVMFQSMEATDEGRRQQRDRLRVVLSVPVEALEARIATAKGAGGRVASRRSPRDVLLVDPEGNEIELRGLL